MISKIGAEVHSENSFLQYEKTAPAEVRKRQVGVYYYHLLFTNSNNLSMLSLINANNYADNH